MIINFTINEQETKISKYALPDEHKSWLLSIKQVILMFKPIEQTGIYEIISGFITRTDGNPARVLFYMFLEKGANHLSFQPTQTLNYKFRLHSISASDIILRLSGTQHKTSDIISGAFTFDYLENARIL